MTIKHALIFNTFKYHVTIKHALMFNTFKYHVAIKRALIFKRLEFECQPKKKCKYYLNNIFISISFIFNFNIYLL